MNRTTHEAGPAALRVLVALATYNEMENLPGLVADILKILPAADVLIIDDGSPDGTGGWCDRFAQSESRFTCLHRPGKQGLGTATCRMIEYAIGNGYDLLINMDADWSHSPTYLPALMDPIIEEKSLPCDVVVGSRYVPGGGVRNWPWRRRAMSRLVNWYARWILSIPCHDCSGSYRCYRVDLLRQIRLTEIRSRGYSVYEELLWHLRRAGARFREVPIIFADRDRGESKINVREALRAAKTLIGLRFR